jgi:hypothetical protein
VSLLIICIWLISLGSHVYALDSLALYDSFDSRFLDPTKWTGEDQNSGAIIVENVREIEQKRLRMVNRTYGRAGSDSGSGIGVTRLYLAKGEKITAMLVTMRINELQVTSCISRPRDTFAAFRLVGFFFNAALPTPNSALNDVLAQLIIQRQSGVSDEYNTLEVIVQVQQCTNSDCTSFDSIGSRKLGTVRLWETFRPSIQWDPENSRFIFQLNSELPIYIPYKVADKSPPGVQNGKHIELLQTVPNCSEGPTPVAFMDVFVNNVFVDQASLR